MSRITSCVHARANLSQLCDEVSSTLDPIIIRRPNKPDVALISADELASLTETAHLLRSPKNAARLLRALARVRAQVTQDQDTSGNFKPPNNALSR